MLSPANMAGRRARFLFHPKSQSSLAQRLHCTGAPVGEIFSFISGLYFRGKLAYANAFADAGYPEPHPILIITSTHGLLPPHVSLNFHDLREMAEVPIHTRSQRYRSCFERDLRPLAAALDTHDRIVLLGSVATPKYLEPMLNILQHRLVIPAAFVGIGDMSRGALLLRSVREGKQLDYVRPDASLVARSEIKGPRVRSRRDERAASVRAE